MRHVSTLQQDNRFKLERQEALTGFVGFYRNKYQGKGLRPLDFLWQTYAMLLMPAISGKELSASEISKTWRDAAGPDKRANLHPKSTLYRINAQKKFLLKANLMGFDITSMPSLVDSLLTAYQDTNPAIRSPRAACPTAAASASATALPARKRLASRRYIRASRRCSTSNRLTFGNGQFKSPRNT
jgi:hypothetical protein